MRLEPGANKWQRISQAIWALIFLALLGVSWFLKPSASGHGTHTQLGLPPCPSVLIFSRPCPGCGMTTSFAQMAKGDVVSAFRTHWFGPLVFAAFAISGLMAGYGALRGWRLDTSARWFNWGMAVFAALFFLYGIVRFQQGFPKENLASRQMSVPTQR